MDAQPSIKTCVIIGHGQSPKGQGLGAEIDRHCVVRLKNPHWQSVEDYGGRCDYMCASTETMQVMLDYKRVPVEYWAQPKKGNWNTKTEAHFRQKAKAPLRICIDIHNHWNPVFRRLSSMTEAECPNHSVGTAAITYVCEFLKPSEILLVGFDNLLNPSLMDYHKADRGLWVTRHDWLGENKMLGLVMNHYGVVVRGIR